MPTDNMRKRMILALFLLSSLGMFGCRMPTSVSADEPNLSAAEDFSDGEELPSLEEDPAPENSEPESPPAETDDGPHLAAIHFPEAANGMKRDRPKRIFLLYYGYQACGPCQTAKPKLKDWATAKQMTTAEENEKQARLASVRFIDIFRDKVTQDLTLDGETQALYPTYLWVDQSGKVLWSNCGVMDGPQLTRTWNLLQKLR